ncbi:uncharacterized protein LOC101221887 [Cucumis sativus]|uniref:J domain-containing protein n=1 Tax=Cucumis sativus TaxID=3659 RepID=A0A0A0KT92_CUCSA|nr:uncharacterized protein LOC101221887 [Cucumis sativus]KGN52845.1 hypothetical protein Csa_014440 [Cucumis sativus]
MVLSSPSLALTEKKQWWLSHKQMANRYVKDARCLIASGGENEVVSALNLLDAALVLAPRYEQALELKARSLLYLRRYKDVADMLQEYLPSMRSGGDESSGSENYSSQQFSREQAKLLVSSSSSSSSTCSISLSELQDHDSSFKCFFSVADLRRKIMAGLLCNCCDNESRWRYVVLGQASCHLGLLEDAMVLLQTGKRLATAASRRESTSRSDDGFSLNNFPILPTTTVESDTTTALLSHVKLLLRRRTAAIAALEAGLPSEAIRLFTKILDGRRPVPQTFLAQCFLHRSSAFRAAGRTADSIADCNRTLTLDPTCIQALETRAHLYESINYLADCLHDLEHLKLLYNSILRDRKLPGPVWKRHNVRYREIPGKLCALTARIQKLKQRVASGETCNVDYYGLIGLRRGCSRSELERAHLLLCLKHAPDKATGFLERCELGDDFDPDSVRDKAKMSALFLYRLLQKGYSSIMTSIMDEEAAEKQRKRTTAVIQMQQQQQSQEGGVDEMELKSEEIVGSNLNHNTSVYQGVFCRDLAVVGNLLSQVGFGRPIAVKYEALSC